MKSKIDFYSLTEYVSVCDKCMIVVTPQTAAHCAGGCTKKIKPGNCRLHENQFKFFGSVCKLCTPNIIIRSINVEMTQEASEAVENEVLMVISNSVITYDRYRVGSSIQESYNHLFGGGRRVDCAFNNDDDLDLTHAPSL